MVALETKKPLGVREAHGKLTRARRARFLDQRRRVVTAKGV